MSTPTETWIVVADGLGARVFEERQRLGPLTERPDLALRSHENRHRAPTHAGSIIDGVHRHGSATAEPAARAEKRFLVDLARTLDAAALAENFRHLVIIAPPRALGVLRAALSPGTAQRIEASDPHERVSEDAETLRARLRHLRTTR